MYREKIERERKRKNLFTIQNHRTTKLRWTLVRKGELNKQ